MQRVNEVVSFVAKILAQTTIAAQKAKTRTRYKVVQYTNELTSDAFEFETVTCYCNLLVPRVSNGINKNNIVEGTLIVGRVRIS